MNNGITEIFIGVILSLICKTRSDLHCDIFPADLRGGKNFTSNSVYIIDIPGNPKSYAPNEKYNISIKMNPAIMETRSFKQFIITIEKMEHNPDDVKTLEEVGDLQLIDNLSKFSERCQKMVIESNFLPKTEINVGWKAPPPGSGCIVFKAVVIEKVEVENWSHIKRILCEETSVDENVQPPVLERCHACDEAKYEVEFKGMWSRNTHTKDFPDDKWRTKFTDVIGSSHRIDQAFWNYGHLASYGLRKLAETEDTDDLETELLENNKNIRTIIKARGLQYPHITESTFALFRVDNQNHLVSLVSKFSPSPDWIVGVANLELCQEDGTWEESRTLNLYPWDVGIDNGISYMSEKQPLPHGEPIRRIKSNSPNDPASPFYDESGEEMKPIAKLIITRQKLYEKECVCQTTDWDETECSKQCNGKIFRTRQYIDPEKSENCNELLNDEIECNTNCGDETSDEEPPAEGSNEELDEGNGESDTDRNGCEAGNWGRWSNCSASCGKGHQTRDRKFIKPHNAERCAHMKLDETRECVEDGDHCESPVDEEPPDPRCSDISWGKWTACSVPCGTGQKHRFGVNRNENDNLDCPDKPFKEVVECYETCNGNEMNVFGSSNPGSVLFEEPIGRVVNCQVTEWSRWSACELKDGDKCGRGYSYRHRTILRHPENGGKPCPNKLLKTKTCRVTCTSAENDRDQDRDIEGQQCKMGKWSNWTPCTGICGNTAKQIRTRQILYKPRGATCPPRNEVKSCSLPNAC